MPPLALTDDQMTAVLHAPQPLEYGLAVFLDVVIEPNAIHKPQPRHR